MTNNLQTGDTVSHCAIPKTVGVLLQREVSTGLGGYVWSVWWLRHPDIEEFGQHAYVGEKWIRHFKPWPGFYKD